MSSELVFCMLLAWVVIFVALLYRLLNVRAPGDAKSLFEINSRTVALVLVLLLFTRVKPSNALLIKIGYAPLFLAVFLMYVVSAYLFRDRAAEDSFSKSVADRRAQLHIWVLFGLMMVVAAL